MVAIDGPVAKSPLRSCCAFNSRVVAEPCGRQLFPHRIMDGLPVIEDLSGNLGEPWLRLNAEAA
jgi:hypothetical protein